MVNEMKSSLCFLVLLAGGCAVSRPDGSYNERTPPSDDAPTGFSNEEGGQKDASVKIPGREGGTAIDPDSDSPLAPYQGTYLMRMDLFSTVGLGDLAPDLNVRSRISNLLLAEVRLEGDQLVSHETLCHQTFTNVCGLCSNGFHVTPDENLFRFYPRASSERALRVSDGALTAGVASLAVGFDAENVDAQTALPTTASDERLWPLSASDRSRVGFRARVRTEAATVKLDCVVTAAQRFTSSFRGAVGKDADSPLEGAAFTLDTNATRLSVLGVEGTPEGLCDAELLGGLPLPPRDEQRVRFARVDPTDRCPPISVFETKLSARAP